MTQEMEYEQMQAKLAKEDASMKKVSEFLDECNGTPATPGEKVDTVIGLQKDIYHLRYLAKDLLALPAEKSEPLLWDVVIMIVSAQDMKGYVETQIAVELEVVDKILSAMIKKFRRA